MPTDCDVKRLRAEIALTDAELRMAALERGRVAPHAAAGHIQRAQDAADVDALLTIALQLHSGAANEHTRNVTRDMVQRALKVQREISR